MTDLTSDSAGPHQLSSIGNDRQPESSVVDERLVAAVEDYIRQREIGDRSGMEAVLIENEDIAAALRECLAGLELMQAVAPDINASRGSIDKMVSAHLMTGDSLGDYRILSEVGRGGMGVVYEAEQVSLSRRVALKVLPFATIFDPRHLQRFKNEATAAAHLNHPNIVEVYGIGSDRGIHFYAMRFVEGVTLADVIEDKRNSQKINSASQQIDDEERASEPESSEGSSKTGGDLAPLSHSVATSPALQAALSTVNCISHKARFHRIAEIGAQAAQAIDHAHQMGIIHRDIKPSNLMLDDRGKLWVTDFGLARVAGDVSMTMTGDIVGTLRYMSPEQVLARRGTVDHRTDIYSLGATLYELLTLRAAVPGNDRQEALHQLAATEPILPRKLDKSIPIELEAIVLKAMEKAPEDRYATALDLAADLQRWIENKPIDARAPSVLVNLKKWGRRHIRILAAMSAAAFMAAVALAGATIITVRAYQREIRERERANQNVETALVALDEMYEKYSANRLLEPETINDFDRKFLGRILEFYEDFAERNRDMPTVPLAVANAHSRIGDLRLVLGGHPEASNAYIAAQAVLGVNQTNPRWPNNADEGYIVAQSVIGQAAADMQLGDPLRIALSQQRVLDIADHLKKVLNHDENARRSRVQLLFTHVDYLYSIGKNDDALAMTSQAIAEIDQHSSPAHLQFDEQLLKAALQLRLADGDAAANRLVEAIEAARRALNTLERLTPPEEGIVFHRSRLADAHHRLADLMWSMSQQEEGWHHLTQAIELFEVNAKVVPACSGHQISAIEANLTAIAYKKYLNPYPLTYLERGVKGTESLVANFPDLPESWNLLGKVMSEKSDLCRRRRNYLEAESLARSAFDAHRKALNLRPDNPRYYNELFNSAQILAHAIEGEVPTIKSLTASEKLYECELPDDQAKFRGLCGIYGKMLAIAKAARETTPDQTEWVGRIEEKQRRAEAKLESLAAQNPSLLNSLAWGLFERDPKRGVELSRRSIELNAEDASFWNTLGFCLLRAGELVEALEAFDRCASLGYGGWHVKSSTLLGRSIVYAKMGDREAAEALFEEAIRHEFATGRPGSSNIYRVEAAALLGFRVNGIDRSPEGNAVDELDP